MQEKTNAELLAELLEKSEIFDKKAAELSISHKVKVTPFAFIAEGQEIIGYMKDPDRLTKMRAIDMCEQSRTQAGALILVTCLVQEESDKRILEERPENDAIYLGAIDFAVRMVSSYNELLKKK